MYNDIDFADKKIISIIIVSIKLTKLLDEIINHKVKMRSQQKNAAK